ncbi:unnamed protein product [Leptidea sinapis]|uniref:Uncharacterized protein n=1 Tax=Leptidea sinapis TaxID=189913 RepID=A0A5E4QXB6_9NEOP|nr:unnamed protein product [Leptidea sinapis]
MPLNGCSGGVLVSALVTLLLLPAHYYVPEYYLGAREVPLELKPVQVITKNAQTFGTWFSLDFPPFELCLTTLLLLTATITYLCDWIQRKLMERRIVKLNQQLGASVARLRRWDARQEQLEATLRTVRHATAEYNLLLYLLVRHAAPAPPDKELPDHEAGHPPAYTI